MKKGILIDPINKTIREVTLESSLDSTLTTLEARSTDIVRLGKKGQQENDIWFDDDIEFEGAEHGFFYGNYGIAGKGLILGCNPNTGESIDTNILLIEVLAKVKLF